MKTIVLLLALLPGLAAGQKLLGTCEGCELIFEGMPKTIPSALTLADASEPGERLFIQGTIYQPDGKTPAPGIVLYVYHTDNKGKYSPLAYQKQARRHGHLRGWVKTDKDGRYSISTIRPASYPNGTAPQHIHPIILEPTGFYYWIDEYLFDDDPHLADKERNPPTPRGGNGVLKVSRDSQGTWQAKRDITLGLNVPNYPARNP